MKDEVKAKDMIKNKLIEMKNQISDLKGYGKKKDIESNQVKQEVRKLKKSKNITKRNAKKRLTFFK